MNFLRNPPLAWLTIVLLFGSGWVTPAAAYVIPSKGFPKLEVSGSSFLSYHNNQISGSQSFFRDDNYGSEQPWTHSSNLYLTGALYKDLEVNASVNIDRYAPDQVRWYLRYNGNDATVLLGEFSANLPGNQFVALNRALTGVQADAVLPKGTLSVISSQLDSTVQTDTFHGRNLSGPYALSTTPIVDGSEVVLLNGIRKERLKDYTLDYSNGVLTFTSGIIVGPADTVTVSYEVSVSGVGGGMLSAVRASYPLGPETTLGVSHLQLNGKSRETVVREERDQFDGTGTPGPFYLRYRPLVAESEVVTFNGVLQPRGTAYRLDYATGELTFKAGYVPHIGVQVVIYYKVAPTQSSGADRAVTGVDVSYHGANGLGVDVQAAQSGGQGSTPGAGALAVAASYAGGRVSASTRYQQQDPNFAPLETVGFRRQDRALDWTMSYSPLEVLTLSTSGSNLRQPYYPYTGSSGSQTLMDERQRTLEVDFHHPNWPQANFRHTNQDARALEGSDLRTRATTDAFTLAWIRDHVTANLALNRSRADRRTPVAGETPTAYDYQGTTDNAALNLGYHPNEKVDLGVVWAADRVRYAQEGQSESRGRSLQLNGSYRPTHALSFSGNLESRTTDDVTNVSGSQVRAQHNGLLNLGADWRPSQRFSLGLNYASDRYEGDDASNSRTNSWGMTAWWQAHEKLALNGYWNQQQLRYVGEGGAAKNNMVGMNTTVGPFGKLSLSLDAQHLWGETAFDVAQYYQTEGVTRRAVRVAEEDGTLPTNSGNRLTTLAAKVSYPIGNRQELFVSGETTKSSGFPSQSRKNSYGFGWSNRLNDQLTFTLDFRRLSFTDEQTESLNYRGKQVNAQVSWNF
jgi:hypothetical protein